MTPEHRRREVLLGEFATLIGYDRDLHSWPDGTRPDVLRAHRSRPAYFVGEAKASENATDLASALRLDNYLRWAAGALARPEVVLLFALCVPVCAEWRVRFRLVIEQLPHPAAVDEETFGSDLVLAATWTPGRAPRRTLAGLGTLLRG